MCKTTSGKPEIKKFCYHTYCDLSCASVTVHVRNAQATGVYSFWLIFTLHFVTDSKGNTDIMDVKKM